MLTWEKKRGKQRPPDVVLRPAVMICIKYVLLQRGIVFYVLYLKNYRS